MSFTKEQAQEFQKVEFMMKEWEVEDVWDKEVDKKIYMSCRKTIRLRQLAKGECKNERLQEIYDKAQEEREGKDIHYLWITINPDESKTELGDLIISIEKLKYKKYTLGYQVVFEQRGETDEDRGKGFHCHILLRFQDIRYDNIKRSIHTMFDKLCLLSFHVNVKPCYDRWVDDKVNYLRGNKWDEEKDDKIVQDKIWRQEKGIPELITFGADLLVEPQM